MSVYETNHKYFKQELTSLLQDLDGIVDSGSPDLEQKYGDRLSVFTNPSSKE